jgi:hypothetical protein
LRAGATPARASATPAGGSTPSAGTPTSGQGSVDDDRPASDRGPSGPDHEVLAWVLRIAALALLPAAFLLGLRGRRRRPGRALPADD